MINSILVTFSILFLVKGDLNYVPVDEDVGKDMTEIVQTRGYQIESHYVTTKDGYILNVFRIPRGAASDSIATTRPPVLLQHGLLDSSYTWVNNYAYESLGFILADAGFDVWFGNNRGNRYSRNHTTLDPNDGSPEFWEFTWDDMASQDVPAVIYYILEQTGAESLGYVGHSEGTIQMFAAGVSTDDSYVSGAVSKVNIFVALAPVTYVSQMRSKVFIALAESALPEKLYQKGDYEFLPYGPVDQIAPEICHLVQRGCDIFLMALCGPTKHINASRIQVYVSETPAGTSMMNMIHWQQGVLKPTFQKFDYGTDAANTEHYGTSEPPLYDLSKLSVPTALFYGLNDYLADPNDVQRLLEEAPADKIVFTDVQEEYAHLDYTWAPDAYEKIYGKVNDLLKQYAAK